VQGQHLGTIQMQPSALVWPVISGCFENFHVSDVPTISLRRHLACASTVEQGCK
jgi:hypothetical protein